MRVDMATARYKDEKRFFKAFGAVVKKYRLKAGFTQENMADHGFSIRFYQRIEAGKPIHVRTILKLADALGVSVKQLFSTF